MKNLQFPAKLEFLFRPARYKVGYGGRGSGKSWGFARALLLRATEKPLTVLCARELQVSIKDSVHKLLSSQIGEMGLAPWYRVQNQSITSKVGSEFIFSGIRNNVTKIKSMEGVDICWLEEAAKISNESLDILIPTIRKPGSEIWFSFNPEEETDPVYQRMVVNPPPDAVVQEITWRDNPWFPMELRREMEYLYRVDPEAAAHVWGGKCRKVSKAQIFRDKYVVESFEADTGDHSEWRGPYFGQDWGFADDPAATVKLWIYQRRLYIEYEAFGYGVENDDLAALIKSIPGASEHTIRADNSRPETISHVASKGRLKIVGCDKGKGSVEDGIQFIRSFEKIVIHPRCKHMQDEARLYSYKVDPVTGDILPIIADKHNHGWDATRYALQPLVKKKRSMYDVL